MNAIYEGRYKDLLAVIVENDIIKATFLPYNGAKMASLYDKVKGRELLCPANGETYRPIGLYSSYIDGECSAFDDMFPTIDPYTPDGGPRKGIDYIDHGEVCRSPFTYEINDSSLKMSFTSNRLFYTYEKSVSFTENGAVRLSYAIKNNDTSAIPFDFLWAAHIMIAAVEGGQVVTSYSEGDDIEVMFDDFGRYGKRWDKLKYKKDMLCSSKYSQNGDAYKLYFTNPAPEGHLSYIFPDNSALTLKYNAKKLPYIGVWMNNGHFKGMYNVAPEIASIPYDAPHEAAKRGVKSEILPGDTFEFDILISIDQ